MKYESEEEQIGAYLDGELSPSEQIRVEQLLDDHPEYRQLYEELRAVRHSLESLPRHQLEEDLGARILRTAEREMLLGAPSRPGGVENGAWTVQSPDTLAEDEPLQRRLSWRTWFWPCVTIAAALAIMVANHNQKQAGRVAKSEERPSSIGSIKARPPEKLQKSPSQVEAALAKVDSSAGKRRETDQAPGVLGQAADQAPTSQPSGDVPPRNEPAAAIAQDNSQGTTPETGANQPEDLQLAKAGQPDARPLFPANAGASFAEGVLLVRCDIHADAVRNKTFQKLLTDEHIAWHAPEPDSAEQAADGAASLLNSAVYVEATTRQVRNVLFQLMERSKDFAGIETRPQSGVAAQQVFLVYNRPNPAGQTAAPSTAAGSVGAVNARALPNVAPGTKPGKLGISVEAPNPVHTPEPPAPPQTAKNPRAKKSPAHRSKTTDAGKADGEEPLDARAEDDVPVRAMFIFRLVDADGKPVT
jgi:negative regulator of sigma E activity